MPRSPAPEDVAQIGLRNTRDVVPVPQSALTAARVTAADAGARIIETIADHQNEMALHRADMDSGAQLDEVRTRFLTDDDWETAPTRASAEARAILNTHGQSLQGSTTQRAWQLRSMERIENFDSAMRAQSRTRGVQLAHADLIQLGQKAIDQAGDLQLSEDVRRGAVISYTGALDAAVRRGLVDPDDAAADQARFNDSVRARVQDGMRGEFINRLALDPAELAADIEDEDGPFRVMAADDRARMAHQAHQAAASATVDEVLAETLRTGSVVGEADPRLAGGWAYLGDGARLQYAERASNALQTHQRAAALGSLAGLTLTDIITRADDAGSGSDTHWAGAVHLRGIQTDPANYVLGTQPTVAALGHAGVEAIATARAHPQDQQAQLAAVRARQAYARATLAAQAAVGLSPGQSRMHTVEQVRAWARRVRQQTPTEQQATLDALPQQMLRMYGDEDLAERAVEEHQEAFYALPSGRDAPVPDPAVAAAQGADYGTVRDRIVRALNNGSDLDDPQVDVLIARLAPGERARLMSDPAIAEAGVGQ